MCLCIPLILMKTTIAFEINKLIQNDECIVDKAKKIPLHMLKQR